MNTKYMVPTWILLIIYLFCESWAFQWSCGWGDGRKAFFVVLVIAMYWQIREITNPWSHLVVLIVAGSSFLDDIFLMALTPISVCPGLMPTPSIEDSLGGAMKKGMGAMTGMADAAGSAMKSAADATIEGMENMANAAEDLAGKAKDKAKEKLEKAKDKFDKFNPFRRRIRAAPELELHLPSPDEALSEEVARRSDRISKRFLSEMSNMASSMTNGLFGAGGGAPGSDPRGNSKTGASKGYITWLAVAFIFSFLDRAVIVVISFFYFKGTKKDMDVMVKARGLDPETGEVADDDGKPRKSTATTQKPRTSQATR